MAAHLQTLWGFIQLLAAGKEKKLERLTLTRLQSPERQDAIMFSLTCGSQLLELCVCKLEAVRTKTDYGIREESMRADRTEGVRREQKSHVIGQWK